MKDYYSILGLTYPSNKSEIKKTYRRLSKIFHPDINGGVSFYDVCFKEIREAYDALINAPNVVSEELVEATTSKIKYFYSNTRTVESGQTVKLSWSTQHCSQININKFGAVPPAGSVEITLNDPQEECVITLSAIGKSGEVIQQDVYMTVVGDKAPADTIPQESPAQKKTASRINKVNRLFVPATAVFGLFAVLGLAGIYGWTTIGNSVDQPVVKVNVPIASPVIAESTPTVISELPQETFAMKASLVVNKDEAIKEKKEASIEEYQNKTPQQVPAKQINRKPKKQLVETAPKIIKKKKPTSFKKGATLKQVLNAQGVPSSMKRVGGNIILHYGSSKVLIENGVVTAFTNQGNLKLKNRSITINKHFKIGSSKQLVLNLQGQPSAIKRLGDYELLQFGNSVVSIVDGKVTGYTNKNNNLKVI